MAKSNLYRILRPAGLIFLLWLTLRYFLPLLLPFLLGCLLALAAETVVRPLTDKAGLPRGAAAGIGVTLTLFLLFCLLLLLLSIAVRQLGRLTVVLPELAGTAMEGLESLEGYLLSLAERSPASIQPALTGSVVRLFHSSDTATQMVGKLPNLLSGFIGRLSASALSVGTGILSAYMISVRLPQLRQRLRELPIAQNLRQWLPGLKQLRSAVGGWLKAQLKLCGISFCILCVGLFLLKIRNAPLWALLIALVDAFPILGTGTVLIPWALISLIQKNSLQAIGLLLIYGATFLSRSILEPKLVGKQLGLDALLTLLCLYVGFQLFGLPGMLLSPLAAVAVKELTHFKTQP